MLIDINKVKQKFFSACNCILGNTKSLDDVLKLSLMESYCLPILMYCTAALKLSVEQVGDLNIGWNSVYRRIFGFHRWESVKSFIYGLGRLDLIRLRYLTIIKFCKYGALNTNKTFKFLINRFYMSVDFKCMCVAAGFCNINYNNLHYISIGKIRSLIFTAFKACI